MPFVQRFGGAANLNVRFHNLVLDGIYYLDDRKQLRFRRLPPPRFNLVRYHGIPAPATGRRSTVVPFTAEDYLFA